MDAGESGAGREPLDEDDHDLLTFGEAGERLREEIAIARASLESAQASGDTEAINCASNRLTALLEAASRNRAGAINDANFAKFFGYSGIAKRNLTHRSNDE